jgi:hypothetical protein
MGGESKEERKRGGQSAINPKKFVTYIKKICLGDLLELLYISCIKLLNMAYPNYKKYHECYKPTIVEFTPSKFLFISLISYNISVLLVLVSLPS